MFKLIIPVFLILNFNFVYASDESKLIGTWDKSYIEDYGKKNADPRWVLTITFGKNNNFIWKSTSLQEIWIQNKDTGETETRTNLIEEELNGTYVIDGDKIIISLSPLPQYEDGDINLAENNLGYNQNTKKAIMQYSFVNDSLVLSAQSEGNRTFYLSRE